VSDSLADVARVTLVPGCNQIVAIREHGEEGYALFDNSDNHNFLIGVAYRRTEDGWAVEQMASGSGWSHVRPDHGTGTMSSWGSAPPGADRVRVEFQGEIREDDVTNGVYFLIWWRAPRSEREPFVTAFRIDGQWIARQRPPSQEATGFASVFEQPTQYFLHSSQCGPETGLRASGPSLALPLDTPDAKLGEAVLYLLSECRRDAPPPASPDRLRKETLALYKPARVRSWAALQRTAKLVHVWVDADGLRVEPTRNGGNRGPGRGFHDLTKQAERLGRSPPPAELGASVRHALLASTLPPQSSGGLTSA
jgi:hypothetical protein